MTNKSLQEYFAQSKKIVFFSGAGISTASGIPDFKSAGGLYSKTYDNLSPEYILSHTCFVKDPQLFYKFYFDKMIYQDAKPNLAHKVIAQWQTSKDITVVTQNIDGLHQAAGSSLVYELHGSINKNYCTKCNKFYSLKELQELRDNLGIPKCKLDNQIIKTSVVLYEEPLDQNILENAIKSIMAADLIIVGGTSLTVYPAAGLINYKSHKAKLVIINKNINAANNQLADLIINDELINVLETLN